MPIGFFHFMSTMRRRKEQQQKNDGAQPPDSEGLKQDSALEDKRRHTPLKNNDSLTEDNRNMILPIILILCRLCGCILLAYGMYLGQTEICTHDECDMTFSMRQFLELDMKRSRSISLSQYRLFKFIDQRDPRHSRFRRYEQPLQGKEWCLDPAQTTAVLYVPGHGKFCSSPPFFKCIARPFSSKQMVSILWYTDMYVRDLLLCRW